MRWLPAMALVASCTTVHTASDGAIGPAGAVDEAGALAFLRDYAVASCEGIRAHCLSHGVLWTDLESCLAHERLVSPLGSARHLHEPLDAIRRGEIGLDAEAAAACLAYVAATCRLESGYVETSAYGPCTQVFYRLSGGGVGERCSFRDPCGQGLDCDFVGFGCRDHGVCAPLRVAGEACNGWPSCEWRDGPMACTSSRPGGAPTCWPTTAVPRSVGETCLVIGVEGGRARIGVCEEAVCGATQCEEVRGAGSPCGTEPARCDSSTSCADRVCTPRETTVAGGPCDASCEYQAGLACDADRCVETTGARGEPCDPLEHCAGDLECQAGRCADPPPPAPDGASCGRDLHCASDCCEAGRCVPR